MERNQQKKTKAFGIIKFSSSKGITLIALVVTIIVLLILAGMSISMLTGENGILKRANEAKEETQRATEDEQRKMAMLEASTNISGMEFQGVPIPAGFAPTRIAGESTVDEGLVITDSEGNEFVWVPVPKAIATAEDAITDSGVTEINFKASTPMATQVTIEGKTGTNYRGILYENWTISEDGSGTVGVKSYNATSNYREPSVVTGDEGNKYDAVEENLTNAGITDQDKDGNVTKEDFLIQMQEDYNEMVKSVEKYGGFYVARYEMSEESGTVKYQRNKTSNYGKTWYEYYNNQRKFVNNKYVKSSMIWGSQYDAMMNWMARCGINVNSTTPSVGAEKNPSRDSIENRKTGYEKDKLNNVYDLLGNSREWTLEATKTHDRVFRSGHCNSNYSPCTRLDYLTTDTNDDICSRASLYIVNLDS